MKRYYVIFVLSISTLATANVPIIPTTPMPAERDTHGSAIVGNSLFVIGGAETKAWKPTASVLRADIQTSKALGFWESVTPLPKKVLYIGTSVVSLGNKLYVVGGQERTDDRSGDSGDKVILNSVLYTTVAPDGSLSPWVESESWGGGAGLSCAAAINSRTLYVSGGGSNADELSKQVFYTPLNSAGEPTNWVETASLPIGLWFHQMAIHGETAYVMNGRSSGEADGQNMLIYRSRIKADGSLNEWQALKETNPSSTFQGACAATNNYAFGIGGKDRNWFIVDKITFGRMTPQGIKDWQTINIPGFKIERLAATASGELGVLFLTGGRTTIEYSTMSNETYSITLRKDSELELALPVGFECLLPYEKALTEIRTSRKKMKLITVSSGSERSAAFAKSFCAIPKEDAFQRAFLHLGTEPEAARRLGLLQAGLTAIVTADEIVETKTEEPFSPFSPPQ